MHQPLVEVVRGDLVESIHFGSLVLLAADGSVELAVGDINDDMYPRSASKLLQAAGVLDLGVELPEDLTAIAASSHSGGEPHVAAVLALLDLYGNSEVDLQCTPSLPIGAAERREYLQAGGTRSALRSDCSGKHAAFLAACRANGWPTSDYLADEHPLQVALKQRVAAATGVEVNYSTYDGCGAPLWSTTLVGLATAYRTACSAGDDTSLGRVAAAMRRFPELVGGPGREPTEAMLALPGVLAKDGADGVFAMAHVDGRAAAFKVSDGSKRAFGPLIAFILNRWGASDVERIPMQPVLGGGRPVGTVRVVSALQD